MDYIIDNYNNYKEEHRLTTNNARRVEFITTSKVFEEHINGTLKILDCAAGTGIYAFHLADKGHQVTATDLAPRHVELIVKQLEGKSYSMETGVMDATDMARFPSESFDVVLNMGPFYHLKEESQRDACLKECLRVLKKGGLLATAYIPRHYVFQNAAIHNPEFLNTALADQVITTGVLNHDDQNCFWTDSYYSSVEEMECIYNNNDLEIIDHFAQDGLAPLFAKTVDSFTNEQFKTWCDYHYRVCRDRSTLGASNHIMILGKKR